MIEGTANVQNNWMYVAGDIGDEASSGLLQPFDLPIEYYEGYDEGEHWTEGDRTQRVFLPSMPAGDLARSSGLERYRSGGVTSAAADCRRRARRGRERGARRAPRPR